MFKDVSTWGKSRTDKPRPDNIVFRIHYQYTFSSKYLDDITKIFRYTFSILCLFCVMVTSYGYIDSSGSAIQCMTDKDTVPGDVLNQYCWIMSTFSLPRHFEVE